MVRYTNGILYLYFLFIVLYSVKHLHRNLQIRNKWYPCDPHIFGNCAWVFAISYVSLVSRIPIEHTLATEQIKIITTRFV